MRKRTWLALTLTVILAAAAVLALGGCGKKAPALSSVSPASETAGGKVTLTGSDFGDTQGDGKVQVGQETAAVESWSGSSIVILVPSGMQPGVFQVSVTTSGGTSASLPFQVTPAAAPNPPHISSIQPTGGPSDTLVTIYGSGFGASQGGGKVNIGAVQMVMVSWSDIRIEMKVPPTMGVGQYVVTVQNSNGTSNAVAFIVTAQVEEQQLEEQAVTQDMNDHGVNPGDWVFKQAKVSASDPTWALLDYQRYEGMAHTQYLLHKVNGVWTVVASGGDDFNPQAYGAPADLKFP